jgi:glycosyltransferase involved in cell wall biosynthesis
LIESVLIYAPNVGGGGGLVLLRELLRSRWPAARVTAILDRRGRHVLGDFGQDVDIHWVTSSLGGRWRAELLLARLASPRGLVLCFHNLPPVLPVRGTVLCYVQNANLVGIIPTSHLSGWLRIRYAVERFIAHRFRHHIDRYAVQTPTMAAALQDWYGSGAPPIDILPFADRDMDVGVATRATEKRWDFIYASDGSVHKNHRRLFAAWRLLAEQGVRPSLAVTLHPERDVALRDEVRAMAAEGIRIDDLGFLPHSDVIDAYYRAGALIFPSYAESFGIPLTEATKMGLPILAPELDYVRDVCDPAVTFDANSPRSIARAVRRFLSQASDRVEILSADQFVATVCDKAQPDTV